MVSETPANLESKLRKRLGCFLRCESVHRKPLMPLLQDIKAHGGSAFIFGGMLRDLMMFGLRRNPRDIDLVVENVSPELNRILEEKLKKMTRFGGFELEVAHWEFDLWAIGSTWAFGHDPKRVVSFENLPHTTFLNVQAVVAELFPRPGKARRIYSHGFFQGLLSKTVEINYEDNPYPVHCLMSGLLTAAKLRFAIGPRLVRYILAHSRGLDLAELLDYQRRRCGTVFAGEDMLSNWIAALRDQHRSSPAEPAKLPGMGFWQDNLL